MIFVILNLCSCGDKKKIDDFRDEFERNIWRREDDPYALSSIKFKAIGFPIDEIIQIFFDEGYGELLSEDMIFPREGKFKTEEGEFFRTYIGECDLRDKGYQVELMFNIRIFNFWGYLITDEIVVVTIDKNQISTSIDSEFAKYWNSLSTTVSDLNDDHN